MLKSKCSRPLEFLPIILIAKQVSFETIRIETNGSYVDVNYIDFMNKLGRFSYIEKEENEDVKLTEKKKDIFNINTIPTFRIYTNMRAVINSGFFNYEEIPYITEETKDLYKQFKVIKLKIPMFIWSQWPMTHTRLSKESQSDRVASSDEYWLPDDLEKRHENMLKTIKSTAEGSSFNVYDINDHIEKYKKGDYEGVFKTFNDFYKWLMIHIVTQEDVQNHLHECDYKQEIWSRAPYYFKYKEVVVTGWYNDPTTWKHSFIERNCEPKLWKNWTQKETQQVLMKVKEVIENGMF